VPLSGTTLDDGYIAGSTLPAGGTTLPAGESDTTTWEISLAAGAPGTAATSSQLALETDLDQVDASSGATSNLDYDNASITAVAGSSATTPTVTPTTTTIYVTQPTVTTIQTEPAVATPCTAPALIGKSPAGAAAAIKLAACTSVTEIEPKHGKRQTLVVGSETPSAGTKLPSGGTLTVTFKAVKTKHATKKTTTRLA
jgi:hypothetical protein